ncbi:hypothetical protein DTO166G4_6483 [Paecilomyces variotii]|uniref:Conidiation protein 6-domain-containing protein n=1 Tax=Byssochlamys spectabilis TaxID=264951 RepID=A0A443HU29_BYSSP|nr:Conidiation protein 6-domain-containing protein [Paecilomyces variotii]KAJ9192850.1 hypothetical protein DTO032I3_8086 [Paecilomyces variotii]KAJ9193172.1 hypothetical protein DTO164E3_7996 [Paecilomyces variotii]KAJ9211955.1 hypothetical protein DTO166G4_6483 [Paecilomyces variotii]KAJ9219984.1 hypothetical protein DTO169C6_7641 [Paecilomyces variotii]KAJ9231952.1 hypothetical protein DTO166G5_6483 [Paecilomyces variotii]
MASQDDPSIRASTEDRVNAMRGFKATLKNPRVSKEAKQHAQDVLDNELHGDEPRQELYNKRGQNVDPTRVAAGYKAATHRPNVTDQGKERAREKLENMGQPEE